MGGNIVLRKPVVVLLRGVNVGGHRSFRPKTLAGELRHLDVFNIGAAGTFVVRKPVPPAKLRAEFARRLPFDTEIVQCGGEEIAGLMSLDPFAERPGGTDVVRFVSVLARAPRESPPLPLILRSGGKWMLKVLTRRGRFVIGVYRRRMEAIRHLGTLDRLFGVPVTTRNWNTLTAIARAVENRREGP